MRRILWQRNYVNDAGPSTFGPTVSLCGPSDRFNDGPVLSIVWRSEIGDDLAVHVPVTDVFQALSELPEGGK